MAELSASRARGEGSNDRDKPIMLTPITTRLGNDRSAII